MSTPAPSTTSGLSLWSSRITMIAELGHVFCCGIPLTVAALSLGANTFALGAFHSLHDHMHAYEVPILLGTGALLLFSGLLQYISFRVDCRTQAQTACHHGDCTPKKFRASRMFLLACGMFVLNIILFFTLNHEVPHPHADTDAHAAHNVTDAPVHRHHGHAH